jgi:hypothetical protein
MSRKADDDPKPDSDDRYKSRNEGKEQTSIPR